MRDISEAKLERKRAIEALHQLNESLEIRVQQRTAQLENANKALESFSYSGYEIINKERDFTIPYFLFDNLLTITNE